MMRGVRGATTVEEDTPEALRGALNTLLKQLVEKNQITSSAILTLFFTVTNDLHSISPARIARETFGWQDIPILCAQEPFIEGLPARCIRVLVQFETDQPQQALTPVYLNQAVALRPDWVM